MNHVRKVFAYMYIGIRYTVYRKIYQLFLDPKSKEQWALAMSTKWLLLGM